MGYLTFALVLLGIIILIFLFQYINSRKSDNIYLLKLKEDYGNTDKSSYDYKRLLTASGYYKRHVIDYHVDDITWSDLSMDDVFADIDSSQSEMGSQVLYYLLRNPLYDTDLIKTRADAIDFWRENSAIREQVQLSLHHYGQTKNYALYDYIDKLCDLENVKGIKNYLVNIILLIASFISIFLLKGIGVIVFIIVLGINFSRYYSDKAKIIPYLSVFKKIIILMDVAQEINDIFINSGFDENICDLKPLLTELKPLKTKFGIQNTSSDAANPIFMMINLVSSLVFWDLIRFSISQKEVALKKDEIDRLFYELGYIDANIALSSYVERLGDKCCKAKFSDNGIEINGLYHPLVENAIPNDITVNKSILLTGSNASGKSTFLKALAISSIFAQVLGYCNADVYKAPIAYVMSAMSIKDDVVAGDSYYMAEIKAVKRIIDACSDIKSKGISQFSFVDELLSGTNTEERIAAATQILKSMSRLGMHVFGATHDIELTSLLKDYYDNYHFTEDLSDGDVKFTYKLQSGEATTRNAIRLLDKLGFPEDIISDAEEMVRFHSREGYWTSQKG